MSVHSYHLECLPEGSSPDIPASQGGGWVRFRGERSLHYCQGYMDAVENDSPRLAYRIIRSDGKVIRASRAVDDVCVGQIAGWPTAGQYEAAAARAMEKAAAIRARAAAEERRRQERAESGQSLQ